MALMLFLATLLSVVLVSDCTSKPSDCSDIYNTGQTDSGIYSIYPAGDDPVSVYCDMINGGWTVIQRRMDGSVNFYRPWNQYKRGFGNVESEYWLGLENMYQLTRNRKYMLRVDLEDFDGRIGFTLYSSFSVGPERDGYKLQVSGFTDGGAGDSLFFHNDQKFTTFGNDPGPDVKKCAKQFLGAFWNADCHFTNPNGVYLWGEDDTRYTIGNVWSSWNNNWDVGMKSISMRIKRAS